MAAEFQSQAVAIDAPIEGWDAYHSLDNMPPNAAIILDNLIPGAGRVDGRGGWLEYADLGTGEPVETIASFQSLVYQRLIAASDGGLWYVEPTTITNIAPVSTYTSDRWQTSNFRKADENGVLILTNGTDVAQIYDGLTIADINTTGTDPGITDFTFIGSLVFKGRVYYWLENDNAFYYTQAGSYQGELKKFDLGGIVQQGGSLVSIVSWTQQDSGDGKDDFIVFIFSTGEVVIYQGDDPETIGYWEMVGRYVMGEPMSIRGTAQYGADTIVMTEDGYVNLASVIQQGRTSDVPQFSRLIHNAVTARTASRGDLYGWECTLFPKQGLFIFNVPLSPDTFEQHVMNTVTERWCRFKDLNVNTWGVHDDKLFAGSQDGKVHWMLEATSDNGVSIQFSGMPAFNYYGNQGLHKHMVAVNVISTYAQPRDIVVTGYADFDVPSILPPIVAPPRYVPSTWSIDPPAPPSVVGSFWDEDYWSGEETPFTTKGWQNVSAYGYAITVLIRFAEGSSPVIWRATNLRFYTAGAH